MRKLLALALFPLLCPPAFPAAFEEAGVAKPGPIEIPAVPPILGPAALSLSLPEIPATISALTPDEAAARLKAFGDGPAVELKATAFAATLPGEQKVTIRVVGESRALPSQNLDAHPIVDERIHQVLVVGGGFSGMNAADYAEQDDVVLLDRAVHPGGMGASGKMSKSGRPYDRSAAYITKPTDEVKEIYKRHKMTAIRKIAIREPIDSVYYKGELIKDVWSKESLKRLPPGFAKFKKDLVRMNREGYFEYDVPEDIPKKARYLDNMTVAEFLAPYGPEVAQYLIDSYTQSAEGGHVDQVGALNFLEFYSDEVVTRYTWPAGTSGGTQIIAHNLRKKHERIFRTRSEVRELKNVTLPDGTSGVEATYERDGKTHVIYARKAVSAVPLNVAAKIIPEMPAERKEAISKIKYADYVVLDLFTLKTIWKEGYDTWVSGKSFTDFIDGLWQLTKGHTKWYRGPGVLTIYMPIAPPGTGGYLSPEAVAHMAVKAAWELREFVPKLAGQKEIVIEANRWPGSIHVAEKGYMTKVAPELAKPLGNIHFAGNNLSAPSFEASLVTGKRAGEAVRKALKKEARAKAPARGRKAKRRRS